MSSFQRMLDEEDRAGRARALAHARLMKEHLLAAGASPEIAARACALAAILSLEQHDETFLCALAHGYPHIFDEHTCDQARTYTEEYRTHAHLHALDRFDTQASE